MKWLKEHCRANTWKIFPRRNSVFRRLTVEKCAGRNSHSEPEKKDRDRLDTRSSHQLKIELPRRGRAHEIRSAPISAEAIRDWINRGYEPPSRNEPVFPPSGFWPDRAFVPGEKKRWMLNTIGIDEQLGEEISYVHLSVWQEGLLLEPGCTYLQRLWSRLR